MKLVYIRGHHHLDEWINGKVVVDGVDEICLENFPDAHRQVFADFASLNEALLDVFYSGNFINHIDLDVDAVKIWEIINLPESKFRTSTWHTVRKGTFDVVFIVRCYLSSEMRRSLDLAVG